MCRDATGHSTSQKQAFANLDTPWLQFKDTQLGQAFECENEWTSAANLCVVIATRTLNTGEYSGLRFLFKHGFLGFEHSWCTGATPTILISLNFWLCPDFEATQQATWLKVKAIKLSLKKNVGVNFTLILCYEVLWYNTSCSGILGCCLHVLLPAVSPQVELKPKSLSSHFLVPSSHHFICNLQPALSPNCHQCLLILPLLVPKQAAGYKLWGLRKRSDNLQLMGPPRFHVRDVFMKENESKLCFLGFAFGVVLGGCFDVNTKTNQA